MIENSLHFQNKDVRKESISFGILYCTVIETQMFVVAPELLKQTFDMRKNMLLFKWWPSQKISKKSADKSCTLCGGGEGVVFCLAGPHVFSNVGGSILDPDPSRSVDPDPGRPRKCSPKMKKIRSFMLRRDLWRLLLSLDILYRGQRRTIRNICKYHSDFGSKKCLILSTVNYWSKNFGQNTKLDLLKILDPDPDAGSKTPVGKYSKMAFSSYGEK
jgi:hypothetical protein